MKMPLYRKYTIHNRGNTKLNHDDSKPFDFQTKLKRDRNY